MENTNKVNNLQINGVKNRYTLGLLATLCFLTSSFGIKAMEDVAANEVGFNIVNLEKSKMLVEQLREIFINKNGSPEENLKEFKDTLAALEKIAGPSIGKIIDDNCLLQTAAYNGQTEAIRVLIGIGADINATGRLGRTALHAAARYGNTEAIKVLVGYDADVSDIFFGFDKYIPLVFEKYICGNSGNNTEKINYKINEALEETKEKVSLDNWNSIVKANKYKRLYGDLKNSLIVIQNLSGIRIGEDKRVGIQKISLDALGIIMSFTGIYFGKKIDVKEGFLKRFIRFVTCSAKRSRV